MREEAMNNQTVLTPQDFVRDLLPVYELDLAMQMLLKADLPFEFREDIVKAVRQAIEAKVAKYSTITQNTGLELLEKTTQDTFRASGADSPRELMLAVAYRNLKMVEYGWIADPQEQGVLVAMACAMEAEQDGEHWPPEKPCRIMADKMITCLKFSGMYNFAMH